MNGYCREHGIALVMTRRQTMSSPAEWGCPVCDGAYTMEEWEQHKQYGEAEAADDRYHTLKDEGEI